MTASIDPQPVSLPFLRTARRKGVRKPLAARLESAASAVSPGDPGAILESRELFEQAALQAVIGEAGNLELSYKLVDSLANVVEHLQLARASDKPDPFRRVWVENDDGERRRGVVLRCRAQEVAVFCPPDRRSLAEIGSVLHVTYRGFSSSVDYELLLNDSVRLPGAQVLHLTRPQGSGAIGRDKRRHAVSMDARFSISDSEGQLSEFFHASRVLDLSSGGVRMTSARPLERGERLRLELAFPDGERTPFTSAGEVVWVKGSEEEGRSYGIQFAQLDAAQTERLHRYLDRLAESNES